MVKLNKSQLPNSVSTRREKYYLYDPVYSLLKDDCYNKCYICEEKDKPDKQVDHLIAPNGDISLENDWNNLLLSCPHCNRTKSDKFNGIINCCKCDPEEYIAISIEPYSKKHVAIKKLKDTREVMETIALLELVYNGEKTATLNAECIDLRRNVFKEVFNFQQAVMDYEKEKDPNTKKGFVNAIRRMVARSSPFAAFKRGMIRENTLYMQKFGAFLEN